MLMEKDNTQEEFSESGDPLYRHSSPQSGDMIPEQEIKDTIDTIDSHLRKFFPESDISIFHEIISDIIHIDIFMVKAGGDRDYHILMTSGMSSLPMNVPEEFGEYRYAELIALLPKVWPLESEYFQDENVYWPIRKLKQLARFPHNYNTWLCFGHTIEQENSEYYADNNRFESIILLSGYTLPEDFMRIETKNKVINIFSMVPIYKAEMKYKLKHGLEGLLELFNKHNIQEIIDVNRVNTCKKKFSFF